MALRLIRFVESEPQFRTEITNRMMRYSSPDAASAAGWTVVDMKRLEDNFPVRLETELRVGP
jgi:hypothetical protein